MTELHVYAIHLYFLSLLRTACFFLLCLANNYVHGAIGWMSDHIIYIYYVIVCSQLLFSILSANICALSDLNKMLNKHFGNFLASGRVCLKATKLRKTHPGLLRGFAGPYALSDTLRTHAVSRPS